MKDIWFEFYEDAIFNGFTEDAASDYADNSCSDYLAFQIDSARDAAKEQR